MKRNKFSLSNTKLLSCDQGKLVPIGLTEILPGDSVQHATKCFMRVSPLVTPVMHPVHAKIHHWFVPNRLVWDNWEKFITGGPDGLDASVFPTITLTNPAVGSLADYLGVPNGTYSPVVSALPFRGYGLIFNNFYRDQDLVTPLTVSTADGNDTTTNITLQSAAWEKDYFTSARPWEQKGPTITIPLTGDAPVVGINEDITMHHEGSSTPRNLFSGAGGALRLDSATGTGDARWDNTALEADLSGISAIDMNDLRLAMALQRYEEARARWGSRYVEYLRYLGVKSSDARLQLPEYLAGGSEPLQFSEVLSTANSGGDVVGALKGHGIAVGRSNRYRRFFEEHGFLFSFLIVRPKAIYADGLNRHWNRRTKEDFWQKELEHVGQQAILNKEVRALHASPDGQFGWQDRYDEYRRTPSTIAGEFRTTLNSWHMARLFASDPALNSSFVTANPTNRIYASTATNQLYVMAKHSIQARRLVAKSGTSFIY